MQRPPRHLQGVGGARPPPYGAARQKHTKSGPESRLKKVSESNQNSPRPEKPTAACRSMSHRQREGSDQGIQGLSGADLVWNTTGRNHRATAYSNPSRSAWNPTCKCLNPRAGAPFPQDNRHFTSIFFDTPRDLRLKCLSAANSADELGRNRDCPRANPDLGNGHSPASLTSFSR